MKYGIDPTVREVSAEVEDVIRKLDDAFLLRSLAHSVVYASTSLSRQTDLQNRGVFPTTATHSTPHTFYYLSTPLPSPPPPLYALSPSDAPSSPRPAGSGVRTPDSARDHPPIICPSWLPQ